MKIDTEIIKKVLYNVDPDAVEDPDFIHTIDVMIMMMEKFQKDHNRTLNRSTKGGRGSSFLEKLRK